MGDKSKYRVMKMQIFLSYTFDNVKEDMTIYKEEIFGPVLSVIRAEDYQAALKLVNNHKFEMALVFIPQVESFHDILQQMLK